MVSFHGADRFLLEHELSSIGITYADQVDCLIVAPGLYQNGFNVSHVAAEQSASDVAQLLYVGSTYVGVVCYPVTNLIYQYWNCWVPKEAIPGEHIADMLDLYLNDEERLRRIPRREHSETERYVHDQARKFLVRSEYIPVEIVDRIRQNIRDVVGNVRETIH